MSHPNAFLHVTWYKAGYRRGFINGLILGLLLTMLSFGLMGCKRPDAASTECPPGMLRTVVLGPWGETLRVICNDPGAPRLPERS